VIGLIYVSPVVLHSSVNVYLRVIVSKLMKEKRPDRTSYMKLIVTIKFRG